jgi:hypothetical protein
MAAIDKYYIRATLFPTVLTGIPMLLFFNIFIAPIYAEPLKNVFEMLPMVTSATFSAAILFLLTQLNRLCAKELFQRWIFEDELSMPSTNHLLYSDRLIECSIKERTRAKIHEHFGIELLSRDEEKSDEVRARKRIAAAVSQIRNVLRGNAMLLRFNTDYGFFRNLVGGSLLAAFIAILILVFSFAEGNDPMKIFAIFLFVVYLTPVLLSRVVISKYGSYYS